MRRLNIIDLQTGNQPIGNEDGLIQVVFNGEIYNYRELRNNLRKQGHTFSTQSDTEVLVHAYEAYGLDMLVQLNGMFAFALYDRRQNQVVLGRDRLGQKPLFYYHTANCLVFASELKSLLLAPQVPRIVNSQALYHYLSLQYIPGPGTIFEGVYQLPPGYYGVWKAGKWHATPYWQPDYREKHQLTSKDWIHQTRHIITSAVERHLVSDVPLGVFLSGGVDSSIVTAIVAQFSSQVKTFSINFDVDQYSEIEHAQRIASSFGTEHHVFQVAGAEILSVLPDVVWYSDQPLADTSCLATYHLARLTRQHVTVALSGDAGDEMFAGYIRYLLDRYLNYYRRLPSFVRQQWIAWFADLLQHNPDIPTDRNWIMGTKRLAQASTISPKASILAWGSFFTEDQKRWLANPEWLAELDPVPTADRLALLYDKSQAHTSLDRTLAVDIQTYLPDDLLAKSDRMSMAHALETRAPFLDNEVITWSLRMPAQFKLRWHTQKWVLRQAFKDVLPNQNVNRIKRGFGMPVSSWLRHDLYTHARDILLADRARSRGYFVPTHTEKLLDDHYTGKAEHGQRIWALLVLEIWLQQYIDGQRLAK